MQLAFGLFLRYFSYRFCCLNVDNQEPHYHKLASVNATLILIARQVCLCVSVCLRVWFFRIRFYAN